jgi:hypothetical protein
MDWLRRRTSAAPIDAAAAAAATPTLPVRQGPLRSTRPQDLLTDAIDDAELLLAFAVQSNQALTGTDKASLSDDLIDAIAAIRCPDAAARTAALAGGDPACWPDPPRRKAFWKAYDAIAVRLAPVSAHSIRASEAYDKQGTVGMFFSPSIQLSLASLVVFLAGMWLQHHWLDGKRIQDRLQTLDAAYDKQHTEFRAAHEKLCALGAGTAAPAASATSAAQSGQAGAKRQAAAAAPAASAAKPSDSPERLQVQRQLWASSHANLMIQQRQLQLLSEIKHWQTRMPSLPWWLLPTAKTAAAPTAAGDPQTPPPADYRTATPAVAGGLATAHACDGLAPLDSALARQRAEAEVVRLRFEANLSMLESMWIPMFMGLLGVSTYMLRSIILRLKASTYTPSFPSLTLVRMVLGMVAGVLGGSLLPGVSESSLKALPPLAMPFVFGYAIEVLFAGLDKLVQTFTPAPAPTGTAAAR